MTGEAITDAWAAHQERHPKVAKTPVPTMQA
eukprot:CAMPEP_0115321980 /NCGR_PEP_ID=MMETSP0270-20121206/81155_1 /TAXON_ID=71861 /ORGANISM="Scrippsiella trochoidea, Strain CCMP3099" /LENGTH=30 /DNA_ID= /DNA_START= /DNA_END= /DNA_ORIENTATION=